MPVEVMGQNNFGTSRRGPPMDDIDAILEQLDRPIRNPAPRGKKIISEAHAKALLGIDVSHRSFDSTLSTTAELSNVNDSRPSPGYQGRGLTSKERRMQRIDLLRNVQAQYHKQEMALGGYHDVFNDPCPEFKPRNFAREESIVSTDDESQMAEPAACAASESQMSVEYMDNDENVARSSQGRVGEGCSTPQCMANNTFAPLREIDVSAVTPFDGVPHEVATTSKSKKSAGRNDSDEKKSAAALSRTNTAAVQASVAQTAPSNDSMDDVLSRMRRTPTRALAAGRRTTLANTSARKVLNIVENKQQGATVSAESSASEINKDTFTIHKDGTYTIHHIESSELSYEQREGTYTIVPENNATSNVEAAPGITSVQAEQQQNQPAALFAVPALPAKKGKNVTKISVDQREERMNTSQKKNASLLEMMDVDVPSPGRALFAARPTKKPRTLAKTPVRSKQNHSDDAMEVSIAMSDISQQPSIASDDGSMVDPISDPRPPQATPTRAPGFSRRQTNTPRSSLRPASVTPTADGSQRGATPYAGMSVEQKREVIKKSVERLSQPKYEGVVCHKARGAPHSPYVGTLSANSTTIEPVTPFEPIDPRRMMVKNAERSGTARRIPQPRTLRNLASRKALFEQDTEPTPKPLRDNLLKRMGDYKPPMASTEKKTPSPTATTDPIATSSVEHDVMSVSIPAVVNTTKESGNDETISVPPPPPPTATDSSFVSPRAPAGRTSVSTSPLEMLSPDAELLHAARSLSLEDVSPAGNDHSCEASDVIPNDQQQRLPQRLLAESVCTVNTPHRSAVESSKRRLMSESLEEDTLISVDGAASSESESVVIDDPIEVRPQSRGPKKEEVMVLKPRQVVHPEPQSTPNVRRSKRNRMKPVRQWLGEKPVYAVSPGGSKTLMGVNEVEVRDKRWLKVRTANYSVAQQREMQLAEHRRRMREKRKEEARKRKLIKIHELKRRHRRGEDLHTTVESIVTSSDEEEDIEAIIHVR